jgi:hypothetical protein
VNVNWGVWVVFELLEERRIERRKAEAVEVTDCLHSSLRIPKTIIKFIAPPTFEHDVPAPAPPSAI